MLLLISVRGKGHPRSCAGSWQQLPALPWLCVTQPDKSLGYLESSLAMANEELSFASVADWQPGARAALICIFDLCFACAAHLGQEQHSTERVLSSRTEGLELSASPGY